MPEDPRPLLTIAIPTYNRRGHLALLLRMIGPQIAELPPVELLISDNASDDGTEELVRQAMADGLRCRYLRNHRNLDADPNFLQCYEQAAGTYVWIFGDDDVLFPGSLGYILQQLREPVDIVYVAPFGFNKEPNERGLANPLPDVFGFDDAAAFVHAVGLRGDFALISAIIVNKDTVERAPHPEFTRGYGTQLLQLGWTFTALARMRRGLLFETGLYSVCEFNPKRMFDLALVFGVNWARAAEMFTGKESPLYGTLLNEELYSWFVINWYGMRRNPSATILRDPVGQMRPLFGRLALFWICVYPILVWPMLPAGGWLWMWRLVRRIDLFVNRLRYRVR
jgi:abequosyltransferase